MTSAEFAPIFDRLTRNFRLPVSADAPKQRAEMFADWFRQLQHYHVDAVEHGVRDLMRTETESFWPPVGKLLDAIKARLTRYDRQPGKCETCLGTTWIEARPWKSNAIVYEGLQRCPDCGVPAPQVDERRNVHPVSDLEIHEYRAGRYGRDLMPDHAKAKHPEKPGNPELKTWMEALRKKLFGHVESNDAA